MKSRLALVSLVALLALTTLPGPAGPAPVSAATARTGPFGTATIDGVQGAGEWDGAAAVPFRVTMSQEAGGSSTDATLFLMNDGKFLYAALRVGAVYDSLTMRLLFDRDRQSPLAPGDDSLEVTLARAVTQPAPLPFRDRFYGSCGTGTCWLDDTQAGSGNPPPGTTDGRAAGAFDLVSGYIELAHPIAGPDRTHDLRLALGATAGFKLETSVSLGGGLGSGALPVQDGLMRPSRSDFSDLVLVSARARISTPQEVVEAIRVEGLSVTPTTSLPGTPLRASFRVVNRSTRTLVVPLDPFGQYLGGWLEQWLTRLGPDSAIGARSVLGASRVGFEPIDVLARLGGTSWPPGVGITFSPQSGAPWTDGHPPGDYRYAVERYPQPSGAPRAQSSTTRFALKGVADEWRGPVGFAGRNGAVTLRAWTTDDGSVALALRALRARTTYGVTIRRGSCSGAFVASAGSVVTNAGGAVTRTIALSASKLAVIRSAAERGPLVVRIGAGSLARCGPLAAVPLYDASLAWRVQRLPGTDSDPYTTTWGAMAASIAATSTGLVVAGLHFQNDCTLEPVNRYWTCQPPTRRATAVWTSTDGLTWAEQILGRDTGVGLVAAGPARSVVVASEASWWSTDGRSWVVSSRPPILRPSRGWGYSEGSVTASGAGFVAVGSDVAQGAGTITTRAWISSDGDTWVASPLDPDLAPLCVADVVAGPASLVAVGSDCDGHGAVAVSHDNGLTWERTAVGSTPPGAAQLQVVVSNPAGFVAYGRTVSGGIGVWMSPDGLGWRAASVVAHLSGWGSSWVSDAVSFGPGTVLVGGSEAAADYLRSDVLVSGDGVTLRWSPWVPSSSDSTMSAAAIWNGRLYAVGTAGEFWLDPAIPLLWTAELRPTP